MIKSPSYLWDTNCLIEAARKWYPFDIAPGFWEAVVLSNQKGHVFTLDKVVSEINEGKIYDWLKSIPRFALQTNTAVLLEYKNVVDYVQKSAIYTEHHKRRFASGADGYLIACAKTYNMTVVTQETRVPNNSQVIKIPNLCEQFCVPYIALPEMIKRLDMRLILKT
ncbi:MAG: DUF4411 family protein [Prevotellaceae bacterium]|jgi:hypothetical protein|nr:DUF4411 family protein [Prevotellaceae bacterium]